MKLKFFDWVIIAIILAFSFLPDPLDIFDLGLPIIEPVLAIAYYLIRKSGGKN